MNIRNILFMLIAVFALTFTVGCGKKDADADKGPTVESICKKADDAKKCLESVKQAKETFDEAEWKKFSTCLDKKDKILKADMMGCLDDKMKEKMMGGGK